MHKYIIDLVLCEAHNYNFGFICLIKAPSNSPLSINHSDS